MKAQILDLKAQGLSYSQISKTLGVSKGSINYHLAKEGLTKAKAKHSKFDWLAIQAYYDLGHTLAECRDHFFVSNGSWSHAVRTGKIIPRSIKIPLEDILSASSSSYKSNDLKLRLISEGYKENVCDGCGNIGIWNGKPLTLQLHHIDGNNTNNTLDNLSILCPNCHVQTDNWGRKKRIE